ncbi:MAG: pentapeptide repeat-containing protein [Ktedonobacteraceae bacterium]|nr:pentapeptide repeat-containing protein [Ktedonobacteraceae bacterium]
MSQIDLSGPLGSHVNLNHTNLSGANGSRTNLCEATLFKANRRDASFTWANLCGVNLHDADLSGAIGLPTRQTERSFRGDTRWEAYSGRKHWQRHVSMPGIRLSITITQEGL